MMKRRLILLALAAVTVMTFTSCEDLLNALFGGTTIDEQITSFQSTLNSADRTNIREHFHPLMAGYQQIADDEVFNTGPLRYANANFTISVTNIVNEVATCTYTDANGTDGTIVFTMVKDGSDYKINKIDLTVLGLTYTLERFAGK